MVKYDIKIFMKTAVRNIVDPPRINLVSNDHNGNEFDFTIYHDNRVVMDLTGKRVTLIVKSPSGAIVQDFCTVTSATEGKASITLKTSMFQEAGEYYVEVQVYDDNSRATSAPFNYTVRRALDANELVVTSNEFSVLQEALVNVDAANKIANETKVIADEVKNTSNQALLSATAAKETVDILTPKVAQANTDATNALNNATSAKNTMDALTPVITKAGTDAAAASSLAGTSKTVSDQALTAATSAKSTVDELVPKVTQAAADANTALSNAQNIVSSNELIENVAGPGLKYVNKDIITTVTNTNVVANKPITVQCVFNRAGTAIEYVLGNGTDNSFHLAVTANNNLFLVINRVNRTVGTVKDGINRLVVIILSDRYIIDLNGAISVVYSQIFNTADPIKISYPGNFKSSFVKGAIVYDRQLTPEEIQHNFSVLNNSKAINQIKDYKLASDEDHVEMSTGRTLREEYLGVIAPMAKEFTSATNSITVNNGLKSRLVGGKIEGQTVKNLAQTRRIPILPTQTGWRINITKIQKSILTPSTKYYIHVYVFNNTMNGRFLISQDFKYNVSSAFNGQTYIEQGFTGYKKFSVTTISDLSKVDSNCGVVSQVETYDITGGIEFAVCVTDVDIDLSYETKNAIPFGLSSTQAVISNNGQKYTFYEPTIQGETKVMKAPKGTQNWVQIDPAETRDTATYDYKLESINGELGSVIGEYDYIDRARKVKVFHTKEIVLNGSESGWSKSESNFTNVSRFDISALSGGLATSSDKVVCNKFVSAFNDLSDYEHCRNSDVSYPEAFIIYINKNRLQTQDILGLKTWLSSNPISVRYRLATPIEVPMTDEEIAQYDVNRQVIDLGGIDGSRNAFEIMEDGSGIYTQNILQRVFDGSYDEVWGLPDLTLEKTMLFWVTYVGGKAINGTTISGVKAVCDRLPSSISATSQLTTDEEGVNAYSSVRVRILKSKLTTPDLAGFKLWLQSNPITVVYQLANPIVTHIPKELVPAVLTQLQNEFKFGDAVAATKATISVPVDRITEIQAQLDQVTAVLNTPSNLSLTANYVEDEYNNLLDQF